MSPSNDPFDDLLNLEEQYYKEGYEEGLKDGAEAGRIEGYSLGLQKGFEKFVEAGRLQSRAMVWANRIPKYQQRRQQQQKQQPDESTANAHGPEEDVECKQEAGQASEDSEERLPTIHSNPRLERNIETLYGLVEPGTLSTENDDEAVNDFDSRMKGAQGKLRIIERVIGEGTTSRKATTLSSPPAKNENIEDIGNIRPPAETKSTKV